MKPILIDVDPTHGRHSVPESKWTDRRLAEHLRQRGMQPLKYNIVYDAAEGIITFPLYNGAAKQVGYQAYRPDMTDKKINDPKLSRYFTYLPSGVDGVFGLECIDETRRDIYIVEGVFKAGILHRLGYNAIAVLTNHPKRLKPWFKILRARFNLIAIGDNDNAGKKLVTTLGNGFQSPKDLDEMTDQEIVNLLENNKI